MKTATNTQIIVKTKENEFGKGEKKEVVRKNSFYIESTRFLQVNSHYQKNNESPTIRMSWPTNMNKLDVLPEFEGLYRLLKEYKPKDSFYEPDSISYDLINQNNLIMNTGYGTFELKKNRIEINPYFNITYFISPLIFKTIGIKESLSNTQLEENLEKILSDLPELKDH